MDWRLFYRHVVRYAVIAQAALVSAGTAANLLGPMTWWKALIAVVGGLLMFAYIADEWPKPTSETKKGPTVSTEGQ